MKKIALLILINTLLQYSCTKKIIQQTQKPNIIFIMADDLGYGDLGCYLQKEIKTPQIDKLASQGIKFTQFYAGSTVCAPSRSVLMTGLHTGTTQIRGNKQFITGGQWPLKKDTKTLAYYLKKSNYKTALIGKWGLGNLNTTGVPNKQGFDYYYGYLDQVRAHNYYPEFLIRNGKKEYLKNKVKYLDNTAWHKGIGSYSTVKKEFSNDLFTKDALQYIEKNKDSSFFLYLAYTIPHDNGEAQNREWHEVPNYGIYTEKKWDKATKGYAAQISRLDGYIGQILEKLKENSLDKNTIVIFTSDNGPLPDNERSYTKFFDSNGYLRGGKRDLYEGGIRVPLIVSWPKKIKANQTSNHLSAFWDILPTLCEISGTGIPNDTDGISFLPELLNKEQINHNYLYFEFNKFGRHPMQAIRKGNWKVVKYRNNDTIITELYDLNKDISEATNIIKNHPMIVKELDSLMTTARTNSTVFPLFKKRI